MKKFEEYTKKEKETAINRGGDRKRDLDDALSLWLNYHSKEFTDHELEVIHTTSPLVEMFGTCDAVQDVKDLIKEFGELD